MCLLAAHNLQCTSLQIDASYLIPKLVFCPNWVSVSNSLQNQIHNAQFIERFICSEEIDLFVLHSLNGYLFGIPSFVFLPMLSLHQCPGRWEGMQVFPEIFVCRTTSAQAVPMLTQFTFLTRLPVEWLCWWAGEFLMPFLFAAGSFPAYATEFMPDPLATSWPSLVSSLLQRLCSLWTGVAGLAEAWHWYGDKERCGVQSEHVEVKQSIAKTQWEWGMFSFEWILCLWNRGAF